MVIGTNTMHKVARKVQEAIDIPLLHIADAAGREIERRGFSKVALMGTKFTMQEDFYHSRLKNKFGVEVLVPEQGTQDYVNDLIFSELCRGVFTTEAHGRFLEILDELASRGAEAAVLGCTEIPLLIKPDDTGLALIDTTGLHARMAVDFALDE
jgi:aspartate racemase